MRSTADSGCEIHRGMGVGGPGGTKLANVARGLIAVSIKRLKRKKGIYKWLI